MQALRYAAWRAEEREVLLAHSMKLPVNRGMDRCPRWIGVLADAGFEAVHRSADGSGRASDPEIMAYAKLNAIVVMTHDLDFGVIRAAPQGEKPGVVQIRADDVRPQAIGNQIVNALHQMAAELDQGALLTINTNRTRLRQLPQRSRE